MYIKLYIVFIFTLLTSTKALSQSDSTRQELYNQEKELSKNLQDKYSEIISYLTKSKKQAALTSKKLLIESQTHWEKYITAYCTLDAIPAKETPRGADSFYRECKIEKIVSRLSELNQIYLDLKAELD